VRRSAQVAGAAAVVLALLVPATPALAASPGPVGRIVFADGFTGQIYSVRPDGTGLRRLTDTPEGSRNLQPEWSPDGSHVAFASDVSGQWRIYEVAADGTQRRLVPGERGAFSNFAPEYAQDGTAFVYERCAPSFERCEIWMMDLDGGHRHALMSRTSGTYDERPDVAPDGRHVAFSRLYSKGIVSRVFVVRIGGDRARAVTRPAIEADNPSWSPDGRRLAFTTGISRPSSGLASIGNDGKGLRRLSTPRFPHNSFGPAYSPTGAQIVFSSDRRYGDLCCEDLFIMNVDGTGQHRLRLRLRGASEPDWGPAA
jgi:TolB protein